ncbi:MAG TPA: Hpt domain-containing protein [Gammaproteobacteria bacterium]|nr:Hpt domain-containing protein [Gammaproteobacteria bacterium]
MGGWKAWVEAGDWPALQRAAHTLFGLLRTLGVTELLASAQQLDGAARARDAAACATLIEGLEARLAGVLTAVERALMPDAAPFESRDDRALDADDAAPVPDTAAFEGWLREGDSAAIEWWQQHATALSGWLGPALARKLNQALAQFEFDAALEAIAAARRRADARAPAAAAEEA